MGKRMETVTVTRVTSRVNSEPLWILSGTHGERLGRVPRRSCARGVLHVV